MTLTPFLRSPRRVWPHALAVAATAQVVAAFPGLACRCAPEGIAAYFARAEVVFMGRAESVELVGDNGGSRAVRFAVEDTPFKGDLSAIDRFATPESSATCGVPVEEGRGYVVFASRRAPGDRVAWFDTCNGTRPLTHGPARDNSAAPTRRPVTFRRPWPASPDAP